eukprot:scaffold3006_cov111-Isochrysis_galbana.AAC.6
MAGRSLQPLPLLALAGMAAGLCAVARAARTRPSIQPEMDLGEVAVAAVDGVAPTVAHPSPPEFGPEQESCPDGYMAGAASGHLTDPLSMGNQKIDFAPAPIEEKISYIENARHR